VADGLLADPTRILVGRIPMPPWAVMTCGPPADPGFRKRPNWRALRSGLPYAARADVRMGPNESAPVTEGAVLHNGAGGRAFAAIGDLRLVGCRAAGRASR
jgi:hypothetical protein